MANVTDRRTLILQTTLDLVAEHGLLNTTISLIAKRAKASPGIIYHYFASKDEIIHSLYEVILNQYTAALMATDPLSQDWFQRLKGIWLSTFRYFVAHPKHASFLEQYKNSAYTQYTQSVEADPNLAPLIAAVRDDMAKGLIKTMPFDVVYALTVDVAKSLAKLQNAGVVQLDEAMLQEIAETSCRALQQT
jgi:TetR/AcrR family transcriptional regulator, repressor of fatR-cypB operon